MKVLVAILAFVSIVSYAIAAEAQVDCSNQVVVGEFDNANTIDLQSLEEGYCNHYGVWIYGRPHPNSYYTPAPSTTSEGIPIIYTGGATYYGPGVMESSAATNGVDLGDCVDGTAVMYGRPISEGFPYPYVWARVVGTSEWSKLCVADSVDSEDMYYHVHTSGFGNGLEVGARIASLWGMIELSADGSTVVDSIKSQVQIEFYFGNSPPPEEVLLVSYFDWWSRNVRFLKDGDVYTLSQILEENPQP